MTPNLFFSGNAEEALALYSAAFGGDPQITRFAGSPAVPGLPAEWESKVLYALLETPHGTISVMDAPPGRQSPPGGSFAIEIDVADDAQGQGIFSKLADGGTVMMPYEQTFFAKKFGMVEDRFGFKWMLRLTEAAG
jgi:PhnB protein